MRRLFSKGFRFWLIVLGLSAAVTMLMPDLISVAMITIIGIPIAIYLMAAPFLFLVVLGTWLATRALGNDWMGKIVGLVVTLMALAVPPYFANDRLERMAQAQVAGDIDKNTKPAGKVIAVRSPVFSGRNKEVQYCDGFCQRALMNGVASQVLVLKQDLNVALDPQMQADSFRMEQRASCPQVKLPNGYDPVEIREERKDWNGKRVDELMQLEIAKGNCLIAEQAPLGIADIVLSYGNAKKGDGVIAAGLSLFADTVRADRISMHERQGADFVETYRKTFVVTHKLAPLYAPTAEGGSQLKMYPALARVRETINISEKYYEKPDWTAFLTERLGFDLALRRGNADAETRTVLKDALLRTGDGATIPAAVGKDFFERIQRNNKMEAEDYAIARHLLEDERFPVPKGAASAVRQATDAPAGYFDAIGAAMFKRLRAFAASDDGKPYPAWHEEAPAIGGVIELLPRETITQHRADLDWLAKQDRLRVRAWMALRRYADFGADGVQPLLWLIDDSQRFREKGGDDWQHPYLAGLTGLCKMGAEGKAAIQPLYDRMDSGVLLNRGSYHRLIVHTLIRMGAEPGAIWLNAREKGANAEKDDAKARSRFDREVERARKQEECWF